MDTFGGALLPRAQPPQHGRATQGAWRRPLVEDESRRRLLALDLVSPPRASVIYFCNIILKDDLVSTVL